MRSFIVLCLFLFANFAATAGPQARVFGDSLGNEYGVASSDGWRYKLAAAVGYAVEQRAVNGAQEADLAGPLTAPGQLYGSPTVAGGWSAVVVIDVGSVLTSADMVDFHERATGQNKVYNLLKYAILGPPASGPATVTWEGADFFITKSDGTGKRKLTTTTP